MNSADFGSTVEATTSASDLLATDDRSTHDLFPFLAPVSGVYRWKRFALPPASGNPNDGTLTPGALPFLWMSEQLAVDVDGRYPQSTVSGTITALGAVAHWIATVTPDGSSKWSGHIWYKNGNASLIPQTEVSVVMTRSVFPHLKAATATFMTGGPTRTRRLSFVSPSFHDVEIEYDWTADAHPVTQISATDHPVHPPALPAEALSIETVFRRAGFRVRKSGGDGELPKAFADAVGQWSTGEMHDAMQAYWSRFANTAQWSMWVLFAALAEDGTGLGGIMFDDIGPNHRQGTAVFTESFISQAPNGEPNPVPWVKRMRFWTAVHEMGHAFNLAHAWQKSHPPTWGTPWIPLSNDNEARSFMNYPYNVTGGVDAFFGDFAYRFIDPELLFMRHAPSQFVQMGNADWFDNHAFEGDIARQTPDFALVVRANRQTPCFDFLEPVVLELKLTNTSTKPQLVDRHVLDPGHGVTVVIKKRGSAARQWLPYSRACHTGDVVVLQPGESVYQPLPVFGGLNGWDVSEPGMYEVNVSAEVAGACAVAQPLRLSIGVPANNEQVALANGMFTNDVGRALAFGGSIVLGSAMDALREVVDRQPGSRAAIHASVALAGPDSRDYKELVLPQGVPNMCAVSDAAGKLKLRPAQPDAASKLLASALLAPKTMAAETHGNIGYKCNVDRLSAIQINSGRSADAAKSQAVLERVLVSRKVLPSVVAEVAAAREALEAPSTARRKRATSK